MTMENLATLGIIVDASGAIRSLDNLDGALGRVGNRSRATGVDVGALTALQREAVGHVGAHSLGYGRLENALASFSAHALGVPPVIEKLSVALGKFAVGSVEISAVLLGVAAVVAVYDKLTEGTRQAREEQEKLVKSLESANDAARKGPESVLNKQFRAEQNGYNALVSRRDLLQTYGARDDDSRITDLNAKIAASWKNLQEFAARQAASTPLQTITTHQDLSAERRAAEQALQASKDYWRIQHEIWQHARGELSDLQRGMKDFAYESRFSGRDAVNKAVIETIAANAGTFSMPTIGINDGLTKEQIKTREKMGILIDDANKNTDKLQQAIYSAVGQLSYVLVNALNLGGGGRGSQIGAAVGAIAGSFLPVPGGAIVGSAIGNAVGSIFGGLFDHHRKAVDNNTAALHQLTAALYNAPTGYKVAGPRYRADDGRRIYEAAAQESYYRRQRGGLGNLGMGAG